MAEPTSEHIASIPPGHKREEEQRRRKDNLEEQQAADTGTERIEKSKLEQRDNEIMRALDPISGSIPVMNAQPGFRYARITDAGTYGNEARISIRLMHQEAKRWGWVPVSGDDPEDARFKGNDCAAGSSLRGVGDTILFRISEENYQRQQAYHERKILRQGAVEENAVTFNEKLKRAGYPAMYHEAGGDFGNDPFLARRFSPDEGRPMPLKTTSFSEGDLRRGSMKGPNGETLQPGYEIPR